jgi:hypothetical protein
LCDPNINDLPSLSIFHQLFLPAQPLFELDS